MSDDEPWSVPAPAFKAEEALLQFKRTLRGLQLSERGTGFELRGKPIITLEVDAQADAPTIKAQLARRLVATPEWDHLTLRSSADVRKLEAELKKRLDRWQRED